MKTLRYSTQYKKDFKRYRNNPSKLAKLLEVFRMLEKEIELPAKYRAHMLKGDYLGCKVTKFHVNLDVYVCLVESTVCQLPVNRRREINYCRYFD